MEHYIVFKKVALIRMPMVNLLVTVFTFLTVTYVVSRLKLAFRDLCWRVGKLNMSGKTSLPYFRAKCCKTVSCFENFHYFIYL